MLGLSIGLFGWTRKASATPGEGIPWDSGASVWDSGASVWSE